MPKAFIASLWIFLKSVLVLIGKYFISDAALDAWRRGKSEGAPRRRRFWDAFKLTATRALTVKNVAFALLLFLILLSLIIPVWINNYFGEVSFESILFTLNSPLSGAANSYAITLSKWLALAALLSACILRATILLKRIRKRVLNASTLQAVNLKFLMMRMVISLNQL